MLENVELQVDAIFINREKYSLKALLIILDQNEPKQQTDSSYCSYLFYENTLVEIDGGDVIWFNAAKPHAVFPRNGLRYLTIWFTNDDAYASSDTSTIRALGLMPNTLATLRRVLPDIMCKPLVPFNITG